MFGLGVWEVGVILVIALLVLGPEKLPKAARYLGKTMREFRRAAYQFQSNLSLEADRLEADDKGTPSRPKVAARAPEGVEEVPKSETETLVVTETTAAESLGESRQQPSESDPSTPPKS